MGACGPASVLCAIALSAGVGIPAQARPAPAAAASAPAPRASAPGHRAAAHEPAASAVAARPAFKRAHKEVIDRPNRGGR